MQRLSERHYTLLNDRLIALERRIERIETTLRIPQLRSCFTSRIVEEDPLEQTVKHLEQLIDPLPEE